MIGGRFQLDLSGLKGVTPGELRKASAIAVMAGASPVKAAVVSNAEGIKRFGFTAKSVRIRRRFYAASLRMVAIVGPSRKYVRTKGKFTRGPKKGQPRKHVPAKVAHLVEKGTKRSRARKFISPALAATWKLYEQRVRDRFGREIEAAIARRAARAARPR